MRTVLVRALLLAMTFYPAALCAAPASQPAAPAEEEDVVGNAITFLLARLAGVEESIKAVDQSLKVAGYQIKVKTNAAAAYQKGNEIMDRKGGSPVSWKDFYGKTAKDFYVRNSFDRDRQGPRDVSVQTSARWGKQQLIRRPPQMDYIYRANSQQAAQATRDATALSGKVDQLLERRRQLQMQQSALWARIAAAMIDECAIAERGLYLFELTPQEPAGPLTAAIAKQRSAAAQAAAQFLRVADRAANQLNESIARDQTAALGALRQNTESAYQVLSTQIAGSEQAQDKSIAEFTAGAKRLNTLIASAVEANSTAVEARQADDEIQLQSARSMLQDALAEYAQQTTSLDDLLTDLVDTWQLKPDPQKPLPDVKVAGVTFSGPGAGVAMAPAGDTATPDELRSVAASLMESRQKLLNIRARPGSPVHQGLTNLRGTVDRSESRGQRGNRRGGEPRPVEDQPGAIATLADLIREAANVSDPSLRQRSVETIAPQFQSLLDTARQFAGRARENLNGDERRALSAASRHLSAAADLFEMTTGLKVRTAS